MMVSNFNIIFSVQKVTGKNTAQHSYSDFDNDNGPWENGIRTMEDKDSLEDKEG